MPAIQSRFRLPFRSITRPTLGAAALALGLMNVACENPDEFDAELAELEDELADADELPADGFTSGGEVVIFDVDDENDDESDDESDDDLDPTRGLDGLKLEEVEPLEIGAISLWSWGTPGNNGAKLNMGSASDRTCFLLGVTGDLEGQWKGAVAGVYVKIENNQWKLYTRAGVGTGVMGHAACIPTTFNRTFVTWGGNSENSGANTKVYPTNGPRGFSQCFLSSVSGTDGWKSSSSWAGLRKQSIWENGEMVPKWTLGGNLLWEQDNTAGGSAQAVCVDIWQSITGWSWIPWSGSPPVTGDLGTSTNRVCSLHRIGGNLAAAPDGWLDGLRIFLQGGNWKVISQSGKYGYGECLNNIVWGWG